MHPHDPTGSNRGPSLAILKQRSLDAAGTYCAIPWRLLPLPCSDTKLILVMVLFWCTAGASSGVRGHDTHMNVQVSDGVAPLGTPQDTVGKRVGLTALGGSNPPSSAP